jgi:hypothetical protein
VHDLSGAEENSAPFCFSATGISAKPLRSLAIALWILELSRFRTENRFPLFLKAL